MHSFVQSGRGVAWLRKGVLICRQGNVTTWDNLVVLASTQSVFIRMHCRFTILFHFNRQNSHDQVRLLHPCLCSYQELPTDGSSACACSRAVCLAELTSKPSRLPTLAPEQISEGEKHAELANQVVMALAITAGSFILFSRCGSPQCDDE